MKDTLIHPLIVLLMRRSVYLCLHPCADDPKRISHYVTEEPTDTRGHRVKLERVLIPFVFLLKVYFSLLIQREIDRVKQGNAKYRY